MKTQEEVEGMIRHSQKIIEDEQAALLKGDPPSIEMLSRANRYIAELQAQQAAYYWVLENEKPLTCDTYFIEGGPGYAITLQCTKWVGHTGAHGVGTRHD